MDVSQDDDEQWAFGLEKDKSKSERSKVSPLPQPSTLL